jgi:hypothetical protein
MADPNDGRDVTESWEAYVSQDPVDNIFARHYMLEQLRANGSFEQQNGRAIFHILEYAENSTVKWMSEYETLDVTPQTPFDQAEFAWKNIGGDVPMSEFEKAITAKGAGKFDVMARKLDNLKSTIEETVNTGLFADGNGTAGKELGGLQLLVSTTPTTGTVGQISRVTFSFWRNQETSGAQSLAAFDKLKASLESVYNSCSNGLGKETPTFCVTTQTVFQGYMGLLVAQERYDRVSSSDKAVSGFKGMTAMFKDIPIGYDAACPTGNAYILNNRNLHLVYQLWMKAYDPVNPSNQFVDVFKVLCSLNLTTDNPRRLGVVDLIT